MEYYGNNDYRDYLAHHGIKGMHWGIRRFQPYSVTGARKGGKTGKEIGLAKRVSDGIGGIKKGIKKKITAHKRKASLEKARNTKKEKQEILRSGSAKKMMANKEKFTTEEIEEFMKRAQTETRLAELRQKQSAVNFEKLDQVNEGAKKVVGYLQTANNLLQQGQSLHKNVTDVAEMINGKSSKKDKEAIINSGDARTIYENREKLTAEELRKAYGRAQTESLLKKMFGDDNNNNNNTNDNNDNSNNTERVSGTVEGVGSNSSSRRTDNGTGSSRHSGPIDVDWREVNDTERASGTVEGTGRNSSSRRTDNSGGSRSGDPIDVEWRDVTNSNRNSSGGLGGNNNPRLNPGSDSTPSGGSGPKTTPPSSGGSGNYLALPQAISKTASQAAKSGSMSEGIKLTFDSAGANASSTKASSKKWDDFAKQNSSSFKATKADRDAVDELTRQFSKNVEDWIKGR